MNLLFILMMRLLLNTGQIEIHHQLILTDLRAEYQEVNRYKKVIKKSIKTITEGNIATYSVSFQSHITGEYLAILYVIKDNQIADKVRRGNLKYHAGQYRRSHLLGTNLIEVVYEIKRPTSSVPHIAVINEIMLIRKDNKVVPILEFEAESRDCTPSGKTGELVKRQILQQGKKTYLQTKRYTFDCADFEWEADIDGLQYVSTTSERIKWKIK